MHIDLSLDWKIVVRDNGGATPPSVDFAVQELADQLRKIAGSSVSLGADGSGGELFILDYGRAEREKPGPAAFSWRAAEDRVELFGADGPALLRCVYDFLDALGFAWIAPGAEGERLPGSCRTDLTRTSGAGASRRPGLCLILGHGAYAERWEEYLAWAARNAYSSVFFHTTRERFAFGALPSSAYEAERGRIADLAQRLGLEIELGGHLLADMIPRRRFATQPELFRMVEGGRRPDGNLCPSNPDSLELLAKKAAVFAVEHPEVSVFHIWPEDLPAGLWCSCPVCRAAGLGSTAQALKTSSAMAEAVAAVRPDARLSFLAYHDTDKLAEFDLGSLPPNLELLWAPRRRSWARGLDDPNCALNRGSALAFDSASRAWRAGGGGRVTVFEYWEDGFLFKGAIPPLASVMSRDLEVYSGGEAGEAAGADAIGILLTGGRLPLAPRPNPWLLPRLAAGGEAPVLMKAWSSSVYGAAGEDMEAYWRALESAWSMALDVQAEDGESAAPMSLGAAIGHPPSDWGDPCKAGVERLSALRASCEPLFDQLRAAEAALREAEESAAPDSRDASSVRSEQDEYRIASSLIELDCARLSVYHELASEEYRAAADLALLALSALGAFRTSLSSLPDKRSRRELRFLGFLFYGLRFHAVRRAMARNPLRRLFDWILCLLLLIARALPLRAAWEPRIGRSVKRGYLRR